MLIADDRPGNDGDVEMKSESIGPEEYHKNQLAKAINLVTQRYELYSKLRHLTEQNFNILLYGYGSKIDFLNYFA